MYYLEENQMLNQHDFMIRRPTTNERFVYTVYKFRTITTVRYTHFLSSVLSHFWVIKSFCKQGITLEPIVSYWLTISSNLGSFWSNSILNHSRTIAKCCHFSVQTATTQPENRFYSIVFFLLHTEVTVSQETRSSG